MFAVCVFLLLAVVLLLAVWGAVSWTGGSARPSPPDLAQTPPRFVPDSPFPPAYEDVCASRRAERDAACLEEAMEAAREARFPAGRQADDVLLDEVVVCAVEEVLEGDDQDDDDDQSSDDPW